VGSSDGIGVWGTVEKVFWDVAEPRTRIGGLKVPVLLFFAVVRLEVQNVALRLVCWI
jgi:hypothetical protein